MEFNTLEVICYNGFIKIPEDAISLENRSIVWYRKCGDSDWRVGEYANGQLSIKNAQDGDEYEIKYAREDKSFVCKRCKRNLNGVPYTTVCHLVDVGSELFQMKDMVQLCNECANVCLENDDEWKIITKVENNNDLK